MAYSTSSPPSKVLQTMTGPNLWFYTSSDVSASVDASGYITNGYNLGMRAGDLLFAYDSTNKIWSAHTVLNSSGTTIDLSDGTVIGGSTNSD